MTVPPSLPLCLPPSLPPSYLAVGREILTSLSLTRCPCGFCHVSNVETHQLTDNMESFFLSETVGLG